MRMFAEWASFFANYLRRFLPAVQAPALAVGLGLWLLALVTWWLCYTSGIVYPLMSPGLVLTYAGAGALVLGLALTLGKGTPPND